MNVFEAVRENGTGALTFHSHANMPAWADREFLRKP